MISGKTGFTGNAGYCYVTALRKDDRTFTVALLGCGWPNNKTYKWQDASLLLNYALGCYTKNDIFEYNKAFPELNVAQGICDTSLHSGINAGKTPKVSLAMKEEPLTFLTKSDDRITVDYDYLTNIEAPVAEGDVLGSATYSINDTVVKKFNIYAAHSVEKFDYSFCLKGVLFKFLLGT